MKNKLFISSLVLLLISCSTQNDTNSKPGSVYLERNTIDLGVIDNPIIQSIPLTIRNSSSDKIKIIDISKSCGCTKVNLEKRFIHPKSKLTFIIKYDPKDDSGKINRSVVLRLSNNDFLVFKLTGIITNKKRPSTKMKGLFQINT